MRQELENSLIEAAFAMRERFYATIEYPAVADYHIVAALEDAAKVKPNCVWARGRPSVQGQLLRSA